MIPYGKHYLDEEDIAAVVDVLRSGHLTQGPMVGKLESAICDYVGSKYAVAVSSCTAGLHLCCIVAGVGSGDSVVTSPITFVASANCASYCGGNVTFADIDSSTINIDPEGIRVAMAQTTNVKAVIPVHFCGQVCDMPSIQSAINDPEVMIIEDAAHALGSVYDCGTKVGSCIYSDMTVFSLHPVKSIAAGEGGVITTNSYEIYKKLLRLRSHGINKEDDEFEDAESAYAEGKVNPWYYEMQELGFHYRITDFQCALALSQLHKLDLFIAKRRQMALRYDEIFNNIDFISPAQLGDRNKSANHIYPVAIDFRKLGRSRSKVMYKLRELGIITQVHYIPVTSQPYYRAMGFSTSDYPKAANYYNRALTLPLYYKLTKEQQDYAVSSLLDALK